MATQSLYESVGISVQPGPPLWRSSAQVFQAFRHEILSYSHQLALDGGLYTSAEISLRLMEEDIVDWIEHGIGRHIVVSDRRGDTIYEGFVNNLSMKFGTVTIVCGPLMNVNNRVKVTYTPYIDITVDPPVTGNATETIYAEDITSQGKYGIQEAVIDGGTMIDSMTYIGGGTPDDEAELVRDAYLANNKDPEVSHEVSFDKAEFELKLEVKGYGLFFDKHIYNSDTLTTVQVPTKIQNVVDANPNTTIFSTNYGDINTAATFLQLTSAFEDKNRTASAIIKELISLGNSTNDRTIFMVRKNRKVYYDAVPTDIKYYYNTNSGVITDELGKEIYPWTVTPGNWMEFIGLRGISQVNSMRETFRRMFLETVNYTAPFGIQIGGNKISKISQILAKKGTGV